MRFGWLAGAAAGGCEMSMAVWALGLDRDYVYAVAKKASAWLPPFFLFAIWGLCWRIFLMHIYIYKCVYVYIYIYIQTHVFFFLSFFNLIKNSLSLFFIDMSYMYRIVQ